MICVARIPLILAQAEPAPDTQGSAQFRFDQISNNLTSDGLISSHWLLVAAGAVMLLLSAVSIVQWWKHRHEQSHPWLMFISAANFAGLGWRHQWTLFWIARHQKLGSPLTLMLAPGTFDQHVKAYLESRAGFRRESHRRVLQDVRELLFGNTA